MNPIDRQLSEPSWQPSRINITRGARSARAFRDGYGRCKTVKILFATIAGCANTCLDTTSAQTREMKWEQLR
jgi:hypothetical protein